MNKLVIIFLTLSVVALASSHVAPTHHVEEPRKYINLGHVEVEEEVTVNESDYTELYVAIADSAFDFFAKLVRAKVDLMIWLKRAVLNMIVNAIVYIQHNGNQISGYANSFLEVMKVFGVNNLQVPQSEYGSSH